MKLLIFSYDYESSPPAISSLMYTKKVKLTNKTKWYEICHLYDGMYDTGTIDHLVKKFKVL